MIALRHTVTAEGAVFRPRWLDEVTGRTDDLRTEEHMVVRVVAESGVLIGRRDVVFLVRNAEIGEPERGD